MTAGHVTSFEDALAGSADGSAVTIGFEAGSQFLEQRAERIEPEFGESARGIDGTAFVGDHADVLADEVQDRRFVEPGLLA